MKKFLLVLVIFGVILFYDKDAGKKPANSLSLSVNNSGRDKYGLLASNYDRNGWAKVNGKWVSNPRSGAVIRYASSQVVATHSNSNTRANRTFSSIQETYPILERVARELVYSDIPALQESFKNYSPLSPNNYYIHDGRHFYSNKALFDYKIQQARAWGSKNDQNGDGKINCQDYAELFYKYAKNEGYQVRYVTNSRLNHAFNAVVINGRWVTIEPQAAEGGLNKSPAMTTRWPNYNSAYDTVKK